jgi:hypothetical protein
MPAFTHFMADLSFFVLSESILYTLSLKQLNCTDLDTVGAEKFEVKVFINILFRLTPVNITHKKAKINNSAHIKNCIRDVRSVNFIYNFFQVLRIFINKYKNNS